MIRLLLLGGFSALAFGFGTVSAVDPDPSHVMLTRGIVGGFVAPHVSLRVIAITTDAGHEIHVLSQPARNAEASYQRGTLTVAQYKELFDTAQKLGMWNLPREVPTGGEDIYKLDTSINLRKGDAVWRNGGPEGCIHRESKVQATPEQRAQFKKMVDAVLADAKMHATKPSDAETFRAVQQQVEKQTPKVKPVAKP